MKKINTLIAASALAVVSATSQAAILNVEGTLTAWDASPSVTTYPVLPEFTGTYDTDTGAYSFTFDDFQASVAVFGIYTADIFTTGTVLSGDGSVDHLVTDTGVSNCVGSPLVCGNQPTSDIFGNISWDGLTGTLNTTRSTAGGSSVATYTFTQEVPVPAAAWLFGSALVGLAGIGRKRKV